MKDNEDFKVIFVFERAYNSVKNYMTGTKEWKYNGYFHLYIPVCDATTPYINLVLEKYLDKGLFFNQKYIVITLPCPYHTAPTVRIVKFSISKLQFEFRMFRHLIITRDLEDVSVNRLIGNKLWDSALSWSEPFSETGVVDTMETNITVDECLDLLTYLMTRKIKK